MSPQTIRHIAVAVVATLGVVLLYLWPTTAKSPSGNPRQDAATSTSPTTPPSTSPSSPTGTPQPPGSSWSATPYNPHERVDTHRPPPNGHTSDRPGPTPSTPSQRQTTPQPSTTPPPATSSGPATSGSPSGGPTTSPSTRTPSPTPSPTDPGTPTTEPPPDCDEVEPTAPQCLAVVEQTSTGVTITWQAPAESDGLQGYQIYVRDQPYEPEEPIGTDPEPTATIEWPYQDDTSDPEVCVTALYPDGSDDDAEPVESERTCITVDNPELKPSEEHPSTSQSPGQRTPSRETSPGSGGSTSSGEESP